MKIAQISPLMESVPPRLYGGTERIVSYLTDELVRLGHEVTLFASADSISAAELVSCASMALRLDGNVRDPTPYYMLMLEGYASSRKNSTFCILSGRRRKPPRYIIWPPLAAHRIRSQGEDDARSSLTARLESNDMLARADAPEVAMVSDCGSKLITARFLAISIG
jgi:hypothetical protein